MSFNDFYIKHKFLFWRSILGLFVMVFILFESSFGGDFDIFISASNDFWNGKIMYEINYNQWYHYYYSPFFAVILKPITLLPEFVYVFIWLVFNVFFVFRIWKIIGSYINKNSFPKNIKIAFALLSFFFVMRLLRDNFHTKQVTILILYLSLEGIYLIQNQKKFSGAFLIALGINIKIMPIVLIPYLFYRKLWKQALLVILFFILLLFIPALFVGFNHNQLLLEAWWKLINPTNSEHMIDVAERSFHSLTTLLPTLLMEKVPDIYALPLKRNILNLNVEQVNIFINAARALMIFITLIFLRSKPFKTAESKMHTLWEISYILLVVPLIFPHQQHYAFFFIFPSTTYLLYFMFYMRINKNEAFSKGKYKIVFVFLCVIFLTINLNFLLGQFQVYYDHFKILTYGALLLIVPLLICRPKYFENL